MFDRPETYQAALTLWYRGPEWAFAVRQGNLAALEWALERSSTFWNGANSLIIPIRADGRTWPIIEQYLAVRPVETCFVHDSVPAVARARAARALGPSISQWANAWDGFDEQELHPLLLQPSYLGEAKPVSLRVPRFAFRSLRRIALATWGHLPDEDVSHYRRGFDVDVVAGSAAHAALLEGQLFGSSPAAQTTRLIRPYGSLAMGRGIFVFRRGSFQELVAFWNLRSRARDVGDRPLLVGVAREALDHPETLSALTRWIETDSLLDQTPDLGITADRGDREAAAAALGSLGFHQHEGTTVSRSLGRRPVDRALSFGFFGPRPSGPIKRGAIAREQVTISAGQASFRLSRPEGFDVRTGHSIRVGIEGLPLAMPLTDGGANAVVPNGYRSSEGVTIITDASVGDGYLELRIPDAWESLKDWAAAEDASVQLSPAGRYGQALLDRLSDLDGLGALADQDALGVLEALAPTSRKKLAQRVVTEARQQVKTQLDEQLLGTLLRDQALFLELRARTAVEIAGEMKVARRRILPALAALIRAGFLVRGAAVSCPRCDFGDVLALAEQDERVRCRACHNDFLLPVLDRNGDLERPYVYRLDGLMARAMDQDLLPVLLALRALLPPAGAPPLLAVWLGLEFDAPYGKSEQDFVFSDGATVWVGECKAHAAGLPDAQLRKLLDLARARGARPVLAAPKGSFPEHQRTSVEGLGGIVLERAQLLA